MTARQKYALHRWLLGVYLARWYEGLADRADVAAQSGTPGCVARVETGPDWSMVGGTFSTAYGVINDIVEDYGTPAEQALIFSGHARPGVQWSVVARFVADHGWGGWGERTKAVCGL